MNAGENAITVQNLSKCYRLGRQEKHHDSMGAALFDLLKSPLENYRRYQSLYRFNADEMNARQPAQDVLWALRDVSFTVKQGEVIGVIGRNGAGKSTLLKIISRITEPSHGWARIQGRISSLLEVGTGFHPELTGRENVYLNGTILGMTRKEVHQKFDEIIDFSGVEKFIDTPVKRYSSGMKVRLAFSVAAHLEPEILIIDEVLAVGDAQFQQKCLGKMQTVSESGRTVLFVSHNMGAINQLCSSAIMLDKGTVVSNGPAKEIVEHYLTTVFATTNNRDLRHVEERKGDGRLLFTAVYLRNSDGQLLHTPISGAPLEIVLEYESFHTLPRVRFLLTIFNQLGVAVSHCTVETTGKNFDITTGAGRVVCRLPKLALPLGHYKIAVAAVDDVAQLDWVPTACVFDVEASTFFAHQFVPPMRYSTALFEQHWQLESLA